MGVNGKPEADALKKSLGISDEENLLRLKETGFIFAESIEKASANPAISMADEGTVEKVKNVRMQRPFNPEDN